MTITPKLTNVETGYAKVARADTGHTIGYVVRDLVGFEAPAHLWMAKTPGKKRIGTADTRADAVKMVVEHAEEMALKRSAAKVAKFVNNFGR